MKTKNVLLFLSAFILTATAGLASAAIDVTPATTAISTDGTAAITAIGGALIGLAGVAIVFKWAKGAIFG
jgi:hypothetical protein